MRFIRLASIFRPTEKQPEYITKPMSRMPCTVPAKSYIKVTRLNSQCVPEHTRPTKRACRTGPNTFVQHALLSACLSTRDAQKGRAAQDQTPLCSTPFGAVLQSCPHFRCGDDTQNFQSIWALPIQPLRRPCQPDRLTSQVTRPCFGELRQPSSMRALTPAAPEAGIS